MPNLKKVSTARLTNLARLEFLRATDMTAIPNAVAASLAQELLALRKELHARTNHISAEDLGKIYK